MKDEQNPAVAGTPELVPDSIYKSGWRPMLGWLVSFGIGGILLSLIFAIFSEPTNAADLIASATVIITMTLAILGVNIKKRSDDKAIGDPTRPTGLMEAVVNRISK